MTSGTLGVMRLATLRRPRAGDREPGTSGVARLDRRTKRLTKRLHQGDIAIIDHVDLDRVGAEALVSAGVAAVINTSPSISGRYRNLGPEILLTAGIPLFDAMEILGRDIVRERLRHALEALGKKEKTA